jgi:Trk K+ transport system NAD-binding subunit
VLVFGASHLGIRLAERLIASAFRVRMIDRVAPPVVDAPWEFSCSDFAIPSDLATARIVYAVTDEDEVNIRIALAVRRASASVPIVIALTQSPLGAKLARHLQSFAFVNPPELAASHFIGAIEAPRPPDATPAPLAIAPRDGEERRRWRPEPLAMRAVTVMGSIFILATTYFRLAEHLSWIDAVYFVVTMMATVGFGDISLKDSSTLSKLVGVAVMVLSVLNTAVIIALITDSLLKRRLLLSFKRRRVTESGHIVVAGVGSVGWRVIEQLLSRGERLVVIDHHEQGRFLPLVAARGVPIVVGDARLERTLRDAGLVRAKALLSMTNLDLANLEVGLNAKVLNPGMRVVLRIFDQELARSLREQLDIHFAFSMSAIAAESMLQYAHHPPGLR